MGYRRLERRRLLAADEQGAPPWGRIARARTDCAAQAETFHPAEWFLHDAASHGTAGPIHTAPHEPAPISQRVLASMLGKGLPLIPDMFSSGDHVRGCGYVARTVHQGIRSTSADYVLKAGPNLV